ncbi:uncharacterized protein BCR38DRAFT_450848, partial [Pseudomassariella vexata]
MGEEKPQSKGEGHGQSKGKGKETAKESSSDLSAGGTGQYGATADDSQRTTGTMVSRIANSASSLTNSLISNPSNANHIGQVLPTRKTQSSSDGFQLSAGETSSYVPQAAPNVPGNTFKSTYVEDYITQEEASFSAFLDERSDLEPTHSSAAHQELAAIAVNRTSQASYAGPSTDFSRTDGMEVVKLLDTGYDEVMQQEPELPLSAAQASSIRRALFGDAGLVRQAIEPAVWESLLNFFPEYLSNGSSDWDYNELQQHLGTPDVAAVRKMWVEQWQDVLSSYTDEVWGDLGALVREAREEVQSLSEQQQGMVPSEMKALRRLRQVLAHIRG